MFEVCSTHFERTHYSVMSELEACQSTGKMPLANWLVCRIVKLFGKPEPCELIKFVSDYSQLPLLEHLSTESRFTALGAQRMVTS